ncbi:cyclin-dependent protein kinase inhibitor SMR13 [Trifolium pratense]|uniref:Uncharacterized protein n=1 Tax=Trifolium pratense TaxID=57577 RepID=A0ACB0J6Z2_TRIPR|nr:cyclin-dependent protein kinase inhibitor SMR13 [Trifolium pratense]CAJ2640192.1 unnamed protein product [Trifolium pratense]
MAPSGRTTATTTNKTLRTTKTTTTTTRRTRTRQPRRTNSKKNKKQEMITNVLPSSCLSKNSSREEEKMEISEVIDVSNSNSPCSTPKGQKFRIPEISTCPPAPKKQRVVSNCSLRRSPLSFFVPPDLDHFFLVTTFPDVSV